MDVFRKQTIGRAAAIALTALSLAGANPALAKKKPEPPVEYGPAPSWERFREIAEQAVRMRLVDPDSAKFNWLRGYQQGFYKPMLAKRVHGYTGCGLVNARNRMGGYTGDTWFIVVIDNDIVRYVEIAQNAYSILGEQCSKANLPPLASMAASPPAKPLYGFRLTPGSGSVVIDTVFPDSPAQRAGIKQGMVIARVNGIALKEMPPEMAQRLIANIDGRAVFEMVSGETITVDRP